MSTNEVLHCEALEIGRESALSAPLDWTVRTGEIWAVAGANGCGKTTLMKTILGFLKPISGSFSLANCRAYLAQAADDANIAPARVKDVVSLGLEQGLSGLIPFYAFRRRGQVKKALAAFELETLANRSFTEISPGERQRVLMAQAIVRAPEILFLDEATSAMDPGHARASFEQLVERAGESGCAVVAISHNLHAQIDAFTHILAFSERKFLLGAKDRVLSKMPQILQP